MSVCYTRTEGTGVLWVPQTQWFTAWVVMKSRLCGTFWTPKTNVPSLAAWNEVVEFVLRVALLYLFFFWFNIFKILFLCPI